jgi:hypothetical protein
MRRTALLMCAALLVGSVARADEFAARLVGMGRTGAGVVTGVDAIGLNPANLHRGGITAMEVALPGFGIYSAVGTRTFSLNDYQFYFGGVGAADSNGKKQGRRLTEADLTDLQSRMADLRGTVAATVRLFAASYATPDLGALGFSVTRHLNAVSGVPSEVIDLLLHGNPIGTTYPIGVTNFEMSAYTKYGVTVSRDLTRSKAFREAMPTWVHHLNVGATLNYVQGHAFSGLDRSESHGTFQTLVDGSLVSTLNYKMHYSYASGLFRSPFSVDPSQLAMPIPGTAGSGFGADIGALFEITVFSPLNAPSLPLIVSLSVTDLGWVHWTENVGAREVDNWSDTIRSVSDSSKINAIKNGVAGKLVSYNAFNAMLPTTLHTGVSSHVESWWHKIPGVLIMSLDWRQGLVNSAGTSVEPRLGLGFEWTPPTKWFCPIIRTAFSSGGYEGAGWALGLGFTAFHSLSIDIATTRAQFIFWPNTVTYVDFGADAKLRF